MKKLFWLLVFSFCGTVCSFSQSLSPMLTVLPSGLKVITLEDHTAPVVNVTTWYRVGARNEHEGITGISHVLEHMLFKSTKNFPNNSIWKTVQQNGAYMNGFTGQDYTGYYVTIASDRMEVAMKIEADRMTNGILDPKEQQPELGVVISELEWRENDPTTYLWQVVNSLAFAAHPYHNPIIGYREDVEALTRDRLMSYYRTYYAPNNAALLIVGDFRTDEALKLAQKYFGKFKKAAPPPGVNTKEPPQRGERRTVIQREGRTQYVMAAYHIPDVKHPDLAPLLMLSEILSSGKTSRLYKKLVLGNLSVDVQVWVDENIDPGLFTILTTVREDRTYREVEDAIYTELAGIAEKGVTEQEIARAYQRIEAQYIYQRDSVTELARQLGYYATVSSYEDYLNFLDKMKKVTAGDIQRAAAEYFQEENRTVGIFMPKKKEKSTYNPLLFSPLAEKSIPLNIPPFIKRGEGGIIPGKEAAYTHVFNDYHRTLDTAVSPGIFPQMKPVAPPSVRREVLENGAVIIVLEDHANPTVSFSGNLRGGSLFDPADLPGVAGMTAGMLNKGTKTRTELQIAESLESVGAELGFSTGFETTAFRGRCLSRDFSSVFEIASDLLLNPSFPAKEFERQKKMTLTRIDEAADDPEQVSENKLSELIYPPGHPRHGLPFEEQKKALEKIKSENLKNFHASAYQPKSFILTVVGDVNADEVVEFARKLFGGWKNTGPVPEMSQPDSEPPSPQRVVMPMPDKTQVSVFLGYPAPVRRTQEDFYAVNIMNHILGYAPLTSRLDIKLREEKGYVYFVNTGFDAGLTAGPFTVSFGASPDKIDSAIEETLIEIKKLVEKGIREDELRDAVRYITGAYPLSLETPAGLARALLNAEYYGLGMDYPWVFKKYYESLTTADINSAARRYLLPDKFTIVIAGPYKEK